MLKILKYHKKQIKYLEKNNLSKEEILKHKIINYIIILGYFSYKNDMPFNEQKEILKDIVSTLNNTLDENNNFFITNNHYESFKKVLNRQTNTKLMNVLSKEELEKYFNIGYSYARYTSQSSSIIEYLSGIYTRKEEKILKYIHK